MSHLTLVLLITILAALPLAGFTWHVIIQLQDLRDLHLRSLSQASSDIAELMQNANTVVGSLKNNPEFACTLPQKQKFIRLIDSPFNCESNPPEQYRAWKPDWKFRRGTHDLFLVPTFDYGVFQFQLDEILSALPAGDRIDPLLIVDEEKKVIASYGSGSVDGSEGMFTLRKIDALSGLSGGPLETLNLDATVVEKVALSGVTFDLLCQPIALDPDTWPEERLAVCGLVNSDRERGEALAVTPLLILMMLAVVVFGVLCWPMLKLLLMAEHERLRFTDLYFLLFGAWGAIMIFVVIILGHQTYSELTEKATRSNSLLAETIEERVQIELDGLYQQLRYLDSIPTEPSKCDRMYEANMLWRPTVNSDFEMVFWVYPDDYGEQVRKLSTKLKRTPFVKLANREYFRVARDDKLWEFDTGHWFAENVRSKTTTIVSTMLSAKSDRCVTRDSGTEVGVGNSGVSERCMNAGYHFIDCDNQKAREAVIAVQARLISVSNPVLSPGVGFAVIDDNGRAIFHSDERRVLKQNLFDEIADGARLRAAVRSHGSQAMESSYLGRPHRFIVKPMSELPWSVVVFSDDEGIRTTILEIVGHTVILIFIFLLINLIGTLLYLLWAGQELPRWFWPTHRSCAFHARWSLLLAVIFAVFISLLTIAEPLVHALLCIAVPGLILLLIIISSRQRVYRLLCKSRRKTITKGLSPRGWYVLASGLLWLNIAVLPAHVFYSNALISGMTEWVKQENVIYGASLEARQCAMTEYYEDVPRDCGELNECECRRGAACRFDIYRSALFDVDDQSLGAARLMSVSNTIWQWFAQFKPIYNDSVAYRRYLSSRDSAIWTSDARGHLTYQHPHTVCSEPEEIPSSVPVVKSDLSNLVVIGLGIVLLIAGYNWLRYVANRVYFCVIESADKFEPDSIMGGDSQVLALIETQETRDGLLETDCEHLAVRELAGPIDQRAYKELQDLMRAHPRLLVLTTFDSASMRGWLPRGLKVKAFVRGSSTSPAEGMDFWSRQLESPISSSWIAGELDSPIATLWPDLKDLLERAREAGMSKREVLLQLSESMNGYYSFLWELCSEEERLVLLHLVHEAVVNPKQFPAVRSLMQRGIIRRDPALRTMSDSFAQWISTHFTEDQIETQAPPSSQFTWSRMRWVFISLLVFVFAFLWFTQRQVVESGLALLSVAAIAIPGLLKLASSLRDFGSQSEG